MSTQDNSRSEGAVIETNRPSALEWNSTGTGPRILPLLSPSEKQKPSEQEGGPKEKVLIPLCPWSRRRGSGPGWVRCPLGQPGKLAQQTGPHHSARAPPPAEPQSTVWASERPRIPIGPHSLGAESLARWREAAYNWATGQVARPARPSWFPGALPSTLILTDCAPIRA